MNDGWHKFDDRHGPNNSYPTPIKGLEFHCHGNEVCGPASLKYGNETIQNLTPGDAFHRAAMIEFHSKFGG